MTTVLQIQNRKIVMENVTHLQMVPDAVLLFPAGYYNLRLTGQEAKDAVEKAKTAGFVGNEDMMVNPRRLVVADEEKSTARLLLDGQAKSIIVPIEFLACLDAVPAEPVSSAGKSRRKSAE